MKIDKNEINEMLDTNTTEDLSKFLTKLKIKHSYTRKLEKMTALINVLSSEDKIKDLLRNLSDVDKEILEHIVFFNFEPSMSKIKDIYEQKKIRLLDYQNLESKSVINILCISKDNVRSLKIYEPYREIIRSIIKVDEYKFKSIDKIDLNLLVKLEGGNPFMFFDKILNYLSKNKVKVNKKLKNLTKANHDKIFDAIDTKKFILDNSVLGEKSEYILELLFNDFKYITPYINILVQSQLIYFDETTIMVDEAECEKYMKLSTVKKAKFLLNSYLNDKYINEFDRYSMVKFDVYYSYVLFNKGRNLIVDILKKLEIDKWYNISSLYEYTRICHHKFLRKNNTRVYYKVNCWEYWADHYRFCAPFINLVLRDYLRIFGIIDSTIDLDVDEWDGAQELMVKHFKLTEFGAMVLDLKEEMPEEKFDDQFIVTKNFEIVLNQNDVIHNLFFSKFLKNISGVYLLNSEGVQKAADKSISPDEIFDYILKYAKDIPNNVMDKLIFWQKNYKNVVLEQYSVAKMDDKTYKMLINDNLYKKLRNDFFEEVIVVKKGKEEALKKYLTKNDRIYIDLD